MENIDQERKETENREIDRDRDGDRREGRKKIRNYYLVK